MQFKVCVKCLIEKKLIDFPSNGKLSGDRKRNICKTCFNLSKKKTLPVRSTKSGYKICIKCLVEKKISCFSKEVNGLFGVRGSCSECEKVRHINYRNNNRNTINEKSRTKYSNMNDKDKNEYVNKKSIQNSNRENIIEYRKSYNKTDVGIFNRYRHDSLRRGYMFDLSFEQFSFLINSNCYLCGKEKCRGVDRFDNSIGYTIDNSKPCCKRCNEIKMHYPYQETIQHITNILSMIR